VTTWFVIASTLYLSTAGLGVRALQRGTSFGRLHHVAFAAALASGVVAALIDRGYDVQLATFLLLCMPFCPARTKRHRIVGILGLCVYAIGFIYRLTVTF
jgi:hypothetical protein